MNQYRKTIRRGAPAAMTAVAVMISLAACTSTTPTTSAGGGVSPTVPTQPNGSATGSGTTASGGGVTDPACTAAVDALQTGGQDLITKISDPQAAQTIAAGLQSKFNAAAGQATAPAVKTAITNLASDIAQLQAALTAHDGTTIQNALGKDAADATALVGACNG